MRKTLGHFSLLEQLGAGGMGVVYRARDPRLQRDVAIKVLPPGSLADSEARKRLRKEALAISRLNHPNIAVVHDFTRDDDVDFLVMEFVPGTTLDEKVAAGPLPETEVVALGSQLANALAAAHQQGVVHRDLKPGNLRVTPEGRLKVLDFGLAQTLSIAENAQTESVLADAGPAGTLPYMSPEQLRNEGVDARSDVWAAGAVLYEISTGRRPFTATTAAALAGDILHRPAGTPRQLRPDMSVQLEQIILKCLDKEPSRRYQSAADLAADLRRLATPSDGVHEMHPVLARRPVVTIGIPAIIALAAAVGVVLWHTRPDVEAGVRTLAVMPLENLTGDSDQQYLADGLTEALTTDLAGVERLNVIARGSLVRARQQGKSSLDVAREVRADAYLEGSVQRAGQRIRISARLIDTDTNAHLWTQSFEREMKDILALQREVARAMVSEVARSSDRWQPGSETREIDPEAHEAYLRGRYFWNKRTAEDLNKAVSYFERATAKDQRYAPAYSGLADAYVSLYDYGFRSAADVTAKARIAARQALELDPRSAEAHASLAHLALHDWDWAEAEKHFREAIAINPSYVTAYHWYALCLTAVGRTEEAVAAMEQAKKLDPLSLRINADLGMALLAARRYDEAVRQEEKTLELQPDFRTALWIQGMALQQQRMLPEAIAKYQEALRSAPGNPNLLAALGNAYAEAGRQEEARKVLSDLTSASRNAPVSAFFFALVYAGLGDTAEALSWLEKAYEERSGSIRYLKVEPRLDRLRDEPRFQELMRRVGLAGQP